jgi:excisionase family DNA binding protein
MTELLTTAEAATRLGIKPVTVRRYIEQGRLPATKRGRDHFISAADLDALERAKPGKPRKPDDQVTPAALKRRIARAS